MQKKSAAVVSVADAKARLSELLGQVAFGGQSVTIVRRGKPMAKLVPIEQPPASPHLANVEGWLDDDDELFEALDQIESARSSHAPRSYAAKPKRRIRK